MQTKNLVSKIVNFVLFGIVIIFALSLIFSYFSIGGIKIFTVMSGSMEPTIKTGSLVFIKREKDYKINDIITFQKGEDTKTIVTHRIIQIEKQEPFTYYYVKGDANETSDPDAVMQYNVIGKVLFSISLLGYIISFAKTLPGLIIFIIIPATIIIYEEIGKIKKEIVEHKKRKTAKKEEEENTSIDDQPKVEKAKKIINGITKEK